MQPAVSGEDRAAWLFELGEQWRRQGQNREAIACYRQALERRPDWPEAHLSLGHTLLLEGDFLAGWEEMEWRWRLPGASLQPFEQPLWAGEPLEGKRILLWAEQGFGDTLQFVRFAAEVQRRGATVLLECQPALARLMRSAPGIDEVIPFGAPLPAFDLHAPLQRLPWILRTTLETIPAQVPYLRPEPVLVERWRKRLAACAGIKIGLVWSGNPRQVSNRSRSLAPELLAPLASIPGVTCFGLQPGTDGVVPKGTAPSVPGFVSGLGEELADFSDTGAALVALDLLITVDTAAAHLAGALGRPVWTLLSRPTDYRWLMEREDSPWYPTMRLWRQERAGDWAPVVARIERTLRELAGQ
jgi:hypothetical protein